MLKKLQERVEQLRKAVEESAAKHNILVGHLSEANYMLREFQNGSILENNGDNASFKKKEDKEDKEDEK